MLSAKIATQLTKEIGYPTSNIESLKQLPDEITQDLAIYPTSEMLQTYPWQNDVRDATKYYEE